MQKARYEFLDGLRGLAALAVAALHASQAFGLDYRPHHASLAVDFFFCLSGFVIAHAYDRRLAEGMTLRDFAGRRLVRLYPMIVLGVGLGWLAAALAASPSDGRLAAFAAAGLALVPLGLFFQQHAFPLNNPMWSLVFELAANGAYALQRRRGGSSRPVALTLLLASGLGLALLARYAGTIDYIGFNSLQTFPFGLVRVLYPFLAGVLIHRYALGRVSVSAPGWVLVLALGAILMTPGFPRAWAYDSAAILLAFPLVVALGARVETTGAAARAWSLAGALSYPFYLIHQPVLKVMALVWERLPQTACPAPLAAAAGLLVAGAASYLALKLYDLPGRRWLGGRPATRLAAEPARS
ncbi:MAG TPA: acyltransferase [Phenylobacterium sp.]|nr:acyltransferase [Phenylobacterium sp.]